MEAHTRTMKSMLAVNDTGLFDWKDTTTGSRSLATPMRLPSGNSMLRGRWDSSAGSL